MSTCTFTTPLPNPPTTLPSCSVPIGSSNSTILDTCCNSEVNPIRSYGAPDGGPDCYMFCTTDTVQTVEECLRQNLGMYEKDAPQFECFNVGVGVQKAESGAGGREGTGKRGRWVVLGLAIVFAVGMM
ncbi:hypothetical protein EJ04DRAFT_506233 [Polyplosphaeria fusca]|uniref:Uncharacterized protein n=1 Tax=Polyplosphaeria fusca TaxID=682080 RepID=A0A9P4QKG5_9PLEO|nr:hypothetical protein EJ04DRAFT_506233 [Polyplosphaeria fusca]